MNSGRFAEPGRRIERRSGPAPTANRKNPAELLTNQTNNTTASASFLALYKRNRRPMLTISTPVKKRTEETRISISVLLSFII